MKKIDFNKVIMIINSNSEKVEINKEQINDNLSELGMDSLSFVRMVVALEEEFDCEIPDSKLLVTEMDTVEKIMNVLQSLYDESDD